jgi:hypothetical protein
VAARPNSTTFDIGGVTRLAARLGRYSPAELDKLLKRAAGTVARRLPVEASRQVAEKILNAPQAKIRPLLSARTTGGGGEHLVILQGLKQRLPLHEFNGARWAGPGAPGAVVKVWRDSAPKTYAGTFAIKGRGIGEGVYVRVPGAGRLPIARRRGPELSRAITDKTHGDIYPSLVAFGQDVLRDEIQRLLKG